VYILDIKNLTKLYGDFKAVDDLSFVVSQGNLFAFLGQNGAGKSTTINIIIGLLGKDSGKIKYGNNQSFNEFKSQIGVVFQNNIFDDLLTVEENLMLYGSLYTKDKNQLKMRYAEIIEIMGLTEYSKKKFKILSGGQKRKAEIARAIFFSPKILFLDEPTTGLDPKTRKEVWSILYRIQQETGMTVFLTTHYMEEAADADQVVIIHKGKMVCAGSPSELKAKFSSDSLIIVPKNEAVFETKLSQLHLNFNKIADKYYIIVDNTEHSIDLLGILKDFIKFYEVKKGSMEDVFLNVVGESIG